MIEVLTPRWNVDYAQHSVSLPREEDSNDEAVKQAHGLCENVSTSCVDNKRNGLFPCKYYINKNAFGNLKLKLTVLLGDPSV